MKRASHAVDEAALKAARHIRAWPTNALANSLVPRQRTRLDNGEETHEPEMGTINVQTQKDEKANDQPNQNDSSHIAAEGEPIVDEQDSYWNLYEESMEMAARAITDARPDPPHRPTRSIIDARPETPHPFFFFRRTLVSESLRHTGASS
jgi:hypothetical protein